MVEALAVMVVMSTLPQALVEEVVLVAMYNSPEEMLLVQVTQVDV
jgi:hypothetical protein